MGRLNFLILILVLQAACAPKNDGPCKQFQGKFEFANTKLTRVKGSIKSNSDPWLYSYLPIQPRKYFYINNPVIDMPEKQNNEFLFHLANDVRGNPNSALEIEPAFKTCLMNLSNNDLKKTNFSKLKVKSKCTGKCRVEQDKTEYTYEMLYSHIFHTSEAIKMAYYLDTDLPVVESIYPKVKDAIALLSIEVYQNDNLIQSNSVALTPSDDMGH